MDDIALMQEIAEALGKELLGRPVPQMGISTTASAPGSDPGNSSSKSRIPCHFGGWPGRVSRPLKPCCSVRLRNPLPRAIGYRLGRHSLKVEELGSTPTGATNSRAWGNCEPVQHAGLNPVPLPVQLRPSSPFGTVAL